MNCISQGFLLSFPEMKYLNNLLKTGFPSFFSFYYEQLIINCLNDYSNYSSLHLFFPEVIITLPRDDKYVGNIQYKSGQMHIYIIKTSRSTIYLQFFLQPVWPTDYSLVLQHLAQSLSVLLYHRFALFQVVVYLQQLQQ